jgi:hypothetical protein
MTSDYPPIAGGFGVVVAGLSANPITRRGSSQALIGSGSTAAYSAHIQELPLVSSLLPMGNSCVISRYCRP